MGRSLRLHYPISLTLRSDRIVVSLSLSLSLSLVFFLLPLRHIQSLIIQLGNLVYIMTGFSALTPARDKIEIDREEEEEEEEKDGEEEEGTRY